MARVVIVMRDNMKKILIILLLITLTGCGIKNTNKKTIISTGFAGYDFARAITKDSENIEVKMLLKPGAEIHDYEPSPKEIVDIQNSDLFIYVGGESDEWVKDVLKDIDTSKTKVIRLMDLVDVVKEELVEGMEEENEEHEEYDEHIWTSPLNAKEIIENLNKEIIKIDPNNKNLYTKNSENYLNEISDIDKEIRSIVDSAKRTELIFGDRFPLRYFVDEYGLSYYAAFPGCSESTEASAKTISFLINKVKTDDIPVILKIELSNGKIAEAIAKETGAKVLEFNAAHNISQEDFDKGITYVDIMRNNIKSLKEALN